MIRLLPFILIPVLIIGGLGYLRYTGTKQNLTTSKAASSDQGPVEVPKTLPAASTAVSPKPAPKVDNSPSPSPSGSFAVSDSRIKDLEVGIVELKARLSALEKATPAPAVSLSQSSVYIPLGSGGGGGDKDWISNNSYGATIDPAEYPGYTSMQLEVNFRLTQKSGTAYARFYNATDQTAKEQVSTISDAFSWQTSYGFTLPAGKKTYTLQMKSTEGVEVQLQSARIKVNF